MIIKSYLDAKNDQPLNVEQTRVFMDATFLDMNKKSMFTEDVADKLGNIGGILYKRLKWGSPQVQLSSGLAAFLCYLSEGNAGELVMWAYTMNRLYECNPKEILDMSDWTHAFKQGIPSKEEKETFWKEQKASLYGLQGNRTGDNLVDQYEFWKIPEKALQTDVSSVE